MAHPYSFDPNSEHKPNPSSVASLKHQDQRDLDQQDIEELIDDKELRHALKDSGTDASAQNRISALNLGFGAKGMLSSDEPRTAEIVKNDSVFVAMKKLSPEHQNLNTITDSEDRAEIDRLYEVRNSQQNF